MEDKEKDDDHNELRERQRARQARSEAADFRRRSGASHKVAWGRGDNTNSIDYGIGNAPKPSTSAKRQAATHSSTQDERRARAANQDEPLFKVKETDAQGQDARTFQARYIRTHATSVRYWVESMLTPRHGMLHV